MQDALDLVFEFEFDEKTAFEAEARGYWGHSKVRLEDGSLCPVVFYDPVRLAQDLEEESLQGRPFLAEKGLIVVKDVTLANMRRAVEELNKEGFFESALE